MSAAGTTADHAAHVPNYDKAREDLQRIMARTATDWEFRQKALSDPRAAFAWVGHTLPDNVNVQFVENHADTTILLPNFVERSDEFTEAELEAVTGGFVDQTAVAEYIGAGVVATVKAVHAAYTWVAGFAGSLGY
jgi:hypothetical protein